MVGCFLKIGYFIDFDCCPNENVQEVWLTKTEFGWPNVEIDQRMVNHHLLFIALPSQLYNYGILQDFKILKA